ncbi:hypothetical protein MO973_19210 [Paenibacillus sp. TRM 82003]|nr:hypothetical protein [Paenibacillus sp. TRM 82003]
MNPSKGDKKDEERNVPAGRPGFNDGLNEQMEDAVDALKQTFTGTGVDQGKTGR